MKEKHLETGQGKIQKICDLLTKETIDPAKEQAREIVENAHIEAKNIIKKANEEKEKIIHEAKAKAQEKKKVIEASINLACKQAIDYLKQEIETKLFDENLQRLVTDTTQNPDLMQEMVLNFMQMMKEEGLDAELEVVVPKAFSLKRFNEMLAKKGLEQLQEESIQIGDFEGGVQMKMVDQNITFDISDRALKEMIATYTRESFRELIFKA